MMIVSSLVSLCAMEVVRDQSSSPRWPSCLPRELYPPLLEATITHYRMCLQEGDSPKARLCVQVMLLAVVRRLGDRRCALQVLDLSSVGFEQCEDEDLDIWGADPSDSIEGWELTKVLCSTVLLCSTVPLAKARAEGDGDPPQGVRRMMEERRARDDVAVRAGIRPAEGTGGGGEQEERVRVRANIYVNSASWERVCAALSGGGPLRLHCCHLYTVDIPGANIAALLALLPRRSLLGLDVTSSGLRMAGLALLLPVLATFPNLRSLELDRCNLNMPGDQPGREGVLRQMAQGMGGLAQLRRLSLTELRLKGQLRTLLGSLPRPLEVLELIELGLSAADLSYLSCSAHASALRCLDLSCSLLDEAALPSLRRLLHQARPCLSHLSLNGCGLTDGLLGALLPSLSLCRALHSLRLGLNPLSCDGVLALVRATGGIPSLRLLLHPNPLEQHLFLQPALLLTPDADALKARQEARQEVWQGAWYLELEKALEEAGRDRDCVRVEVEHCRTNIRCLLGPF